MPEWFVKELLRFGAIYWCPVPPPIPQEALERMSPEQIARNQTIQAKALAAAGKTSGNNIPRRATADERVEEGAFVRVHVHPKRFPAAYSHSWKDCIVHQDEDCLVVDKPGGVPVAPTVDNLIESCLTCAAEVAGHRGPLLITHRLDQCTQGLVMLAKTAAFVARFNALQHRITIDGHPCVRKFYRTLTAAPPPLGPMVHYLKVGHRQKGLPTHTVVCGDAEDGALRSELEVLETRRVRLSGCAEEQWGSHAFESLLELKTGRTHQELLNGRRLNTPTAAIGLQSCRLLIWGWTGESKEEDAWTSFDAKDPWWRLTQC